MPHTLVAFHAPPGRRGLLTAGTMARPPRRGTGRPGPWPPTARPGSLRRPSATRRPWARGGWARPKAQRRCWGWLGWRAWGMPTPGWAGAGPDPAGQVRFVRTSVAEAAERLAAILREENASVLLTYDANGGYGHRDHVMIHHVGPEAAMLARTHASSRRPSCGTRSPGHRPGPEGLPLPAGVRPHLLRARLRPRSADPPDLGAPPYPRQAGRDAGAREPGQRRWWRRPHLAAFLRIPRPVYDLVFGREWYVDPVTPGSPVSRDIFEGAVT